MLGIDPFELGVNLCFDGSEFEGFYQRGVGILKFGILTNYSNFNYFLVFQFFRNFQIVIDPFKLGQRLVQLELLLYNFADSLVFQNVHHFQQVLDIFSTKNMVHGQAAKQSNLFLGGLGDRLGGSTHNQVRNKAHVSQLFDSLLSNFGFLLATG